jgi:hypothetical protein
MPKVFNGTENMQLVYDTGYPSTFIPPKLIKAGDYWYCCMDYWGSASVVLKSSDLTTWTDTTFPSDKNYTESKITKDSDNNIYVVTLVSSERVIYVHKYNGTSWTTDTLPQLPSATLMSDVHICIDSSDIPHVICRDTTYTAFHNYITSGNWTTWESVGNLNRLYVHGVCIGSNNTIHIAVWGRTTSGDSYEIKYISGSRGSWGSFETVLENPRSNQTQIVITSSGVVYIVCARAGTEVGHAVLTVISGNSGSWTTTDLLSGIKYMEGLSVSTDGTYVHIVSVDGQNYAGENTPMYYSHNISGSWTTPITLNTSNGQNPSIYATSDDTVIIFNNYDADAVYTLIGSEEYEFPILIPEYRGRIMICEYQGTMSAEAGTSSTCIIATAHNLNDADMIVNTTRKSTSIAGMERGSRKIVVEDENTLLLSDGVPILGQTTGDEIRLYKYIDRTDLVKVGSLNIGLQTGNKGEASLQLVIPVNGTPTYEVVGGQYVRIHLDDELVFNGVIAEMTAKRPTPEIMFKDVKCIDLNNIPARRVIRVDFHSSVGIPIEQNTKTGEIVEMMQEYLAQDGIALGEIREGDELGEDWIWDCLTIADVLDGCASKSGLQWYVDKEMFLHFRRNPTTVSVSEHIIDEESEDYLRDYRNVSVSEQMGNYVNKVFINGGADRFGADVFVISSDLSEINRIQDKTGGSGVHGQVYKDSALIEVYPITAEAGTSSTHIVYTGQTMVVGEMYINITRQPIVYTFITDLIDENTVECEPVAGQQAGDTLLYYPTCFKVGRSILYVQCLRPFQLEFESFNIDFAVGQKIRINLPSMEINNADFLIEQVDIEDLTDNLFRAKVKCTIRLEDRFSTMRTPNYLDYWRGF